MKYSHRVSAIHWLCTANKFKSLKLYFRTRSTLPEVGCGEHAPMFFRETYILSAIICGEGGDELMILLDPSMHIFSVTFKTRVLSSRSTGWRDSTEESFAG